MHIQKFTNIPFLFPFFFFFDGINLFLLFIQLTFSTRRSNHNSLVNSLHSNVSPCTVNTSSTSKYIMHAFCYILVVLTNTEWPVKILDSIRTYARGSAQAGSKQPAQFLYMYALIIAALQTLLYVLGHHHHSEISGQYRTSVMLVFYPGCPFKIYSCYYYVDVGNKPFRI